MSSVATILAVRSLLESQVRDGGENHAAMRSSLPLAHHISSGCPSCVGGILADHDCSFFCDHDGGCVGVTRNKFRHD